MSNTPIPVDHMRAAATPGRVGQATAVEQSRAVAEVQAAVIVAQQCKRNVADARAEMQASCAELGLAERAFYKYPRGGETVTGASVYLARDLARCWGNVQHGIAELRRDDEHGQSEMQAWAWDVQTNTRVSNTFIVPHKRDKRGGAVPLTDLRDIYENNANQGARRLREAIFAVLPPWFTEEAKELCMGTVDRGDGRPLEVRIDAVVKAFDGLGVKVDRLERKLGQPREKWTSFDVAQLVITGKSLRRGEIAVDEEFPPVRVTTDEIAQQGANGAPATPVKKVAAKKAAARAAATEPEPSPSAEPPPDSPWAPADPEPVESEG